MKTRSMALINLSMKRPWVTQTTSAAGPETVRGCNGGGILPFVRSLSGSASTKTRPKPNKNNVKHGISWEGSDQSTVTLWQSTTEHLGYHLSKYIIIPVLVIQNALNGTMTRNNEPTPSKFSAAPVLSCGKASSQPAASFNYRDSQSKLCSQKYQNSKITQLQQLPVDYICNCRLTIYEYILIYLQYTDI